MPTLYLLRHAKSSWNDPSLADLDRPLSPRGRRNAALLAAHLRDDAIRPAIILCSPARRARETAELLGVEFELDDELYGAGAGQLAAVIAALPGSLASTMLIGHNPGLEDLGHSLGAEGRLRTAELWTFELDGWSSREGRLAGTFLPR